MLSLRWSELAVIILYGYWLWLQLNTCKTSAFLPEIKTLETIELKSLWSGKEKYLAGIVLGLCTSRICQFLLFNGPDLLTSRTYYKAYFFHLVRCGSGCWLELDNGGEVISSWDWSVFAFVFILFYLLDYFFQFNLGWFIPGV